MKYSGGFQDADDTTMYAELHMKNSDDVRNIEILGRTTGGDVVYRDVSTGYVRMVSADGEDTAVLWTENVPVHVENLPLVTHEGTADTHPGVVTTGRVSENGKTHALSDHGTTSLCKRTVEHAGSMSAAWFVDDPGACATCKRVIR